MTSFCLRSDGGEGFALYSVRDRPDGEGVRGRRLLVPFLALSATSISIGSTVVPGILKYLNASNFYGINKTRERMI